MAEPGLVSRTDSGVTVAVQVTPKARRQRIDGVVVGRDGRPAIRVAVTAAPENGRANAAVVALLARAWRIPKSSIAVRSGASGRRKVLSVSGDPSVLEERIAQSAEDMSDG
jgi:uncharacterized protein